MTADRTQPTDRTPPAGSRHPNPAAGETYHVLAGPALDDLRLVIDLAPVHHAPPAHVHPGVTETFSVTHGAVDLRLGRSWRTVPAGETVTAPPGAVHGYRNRSGRPARLEVAVAPGRHMRAFFADMFALQATGRVTATGQLHVGDAARLFRRHPDAMLLPGLPRPAQRVLWRALSLLPGQAPPH